MKCFLAATASLLALLAAGAGSASGKGRALAESADVTRVEIAFDFAACSGDTVPFTATLHNVDRIGTSSDGGLHLVSHTQIHGIGVGAPSGDVYRINEDLASTTANFRQNDDGTVSFEITFLNGVVAVSEGALDNTRIFLLTHVTVNANGEPTAEVVEARTECNG